MHITIIAGGFIGFDICSQLKIKSISKNNDSKDLL